MSEKTSATEKLDAMAAMAELEILANSKRAAEAFKRPEFKKGDLVVYGTYGVGHIAGIDTFVVNDSNILLYSVSFEQSRLHLKIPVSRAEMAGLRRVKSGELKPTETVSTSSGGTGDAKIQITPYQSELAQLRAISGYLPGEGRKAPWEITEEDKERFKLAAEYAEARRSHEAALQRQNLQRMLETAAQLQPAPKSGKPASRQPERELLPSEKWMAEIRAELANNPEPEPSRPGPTRGRYRGLER